MLNIWSHEALNKGFSDFLRHYNFLFQIEKNRLPHFILAGKKMLDLQSRQSK